MSWAGINETPLEKDAHRLDYKTPVRRAVTYPTLTLEKT